ncbi:MAG: MarR family winged helix-turn-helix transcriptional regulator [Anaerolineaceae bacterium]|nr:MarR family winged helix-turn-helix transcriptional regulator [Anaerolineaceae bacterium]
MDLDKLSLFESIKSSFLHIDAHEKALLTRHNITLPRFFTLLHVYNNPGINQMDLTALMLCTKGNITRILQGMEVEKLVERSENPEDGRSTLVNITESGQALLFKIYKDYEGLISELMGKFTPEQLKKYSQDLNCIENTLNPKAPETAMKTGKHTLVLKREDVVN